MNSVFTFSLSKLFPRGSSPYLVDCSSPNPSGYDDFNFSYLCLIKPFIYLSFTSGTDKASELELSLHGNSKLFMDNMGMKPQDIAAHDYLNPLPKSS